MGIRVLSCNGNLISFEEAKDREWGVLRYGCGFYLPIYSWVRMIKSYREYIDTYDNEWYRETELIYENWTKQRRVIAAVLAVILIFISFFTETDIQRPIYRGKNVTILQFTKNYNFIYKQLFDNYSEHMTTNGVFFRDPNVVYLDGDQSSLPQFQFELEGEYIKSLSYEAEYLFIFEDRQLPPQCIAAAVAMVGAQKNVNMFEYLRFIDRIGNALQNGDGTPGNCSGEITVENVRVTWSEVMDIDVSLMNATYIFEVSLID